jgi:malonyl-CoA decarboxylase
MNGRRVNELLRLFGEGKAAKEVALEPLEAFRATYLESSGEERLAFFDRLLREMEVPRDEVEPSLKAVLAASPGDAVQWTSLLTDLRRKLESPRMRSFRRFLNLSGGLKFLLDFRADVLGARRRGGLDPGPLSEEIAHLFDSWFQHGFLFLHEVTQDSSYRQIHFLKEHDMVHPMGSLDEMGMRLGEDRRAFALYHRAMPEEPVVFIEVALTRHLPVSIHEILDGTSQAATSRPDTAVFYSINNTQNGLAGLGLGKLLIFQVVETIRTDQPGISTYATLSPVTGFWPRYLRPILLGQDEAFQMKRGVCESYFPERLRRRLAGESDGFCTALVETLDRADWIEDKRLARELAKPLREIVYFYITHEKNARGRPLNPVAGFHLGNGARLSFKNVHFGGNRSERGLRDSASLMVSYVYSSTWLHQLRRTARSVLPWENRPG